MFEFSKYFSGQDLAGLNVVRHYKKVIHLSCIVLCNGQTINKECLLPCVDVSNHHKVPLQQPTRSDFTLWATAIKRISSKFLVLPVPLSKYISSPYYDFIWTTNTDRSSLYLRIITDGITRYIAYHPTHKIRTCSGTRFTKSNTYCDSPLPYYESVMRSLDKDVQLHSWTDQYVGKPILTLFWDNIRSLDNPSLWRKLRCDVEGT
jgi:hypothetical protein